ncbi:LysR family transcriptional regulator [Parachitinimonas caeni]|uniref:LysR family transcriptional regulator n=1 Tax=Parachitinimonas caeni TaxID=3031301 RepID=A0ABT7DZI4_9NEIS|nr:LysR family transcriptional regulator [Parachitinimonas caeni]MDK2125476.1 LysR family transcriptional regulator [Parachitinimonas caeni]
MSVTFKDLEYFVAVAHSRTLSEASDKLGLAQPSLSLAIKKLENELKAPLFIRGRNGIQLTPQGRTLLPDAESAMHLLANMKGGKCKLRFSIGCHPSVGMFVLGRFLKAIHEGGHELDLTIINGSSAEINRRVALGEIDFGLVMNPFTIPGLITKHIGGDQVAVWRSPRQYRNSLIYNPDLLQSTSILSNWATPPRDQIEVTNLELIANLVDSGAGIGILPGQVVFAQRLNLERVPDTPVHHDRLALICYPEIIQSPQGKLIHQELKNSFIPVQV